MRIGRISHQINRGEYDLFTLHNQLAPLQAEAQERYREVMRDSSASQAEKEHAANMLNLTLSIPNLIAEREATKRAGELQQKQLEARLAQSINPGAAKTNPAQDGFPLNPHVPINYGMPISPNAGQPMGNPYQNGIYPTPGIPNIGMMNFNSNSLNHGMPFMNNTFWNPYAGGMPLGGGMNYGLGFNMFGMGNNNFANPFMSNMPSPFFGTNMPMMNGGPMISPMGMTQPMMPSPMGVF
jgi:hypothetical protein